MCGIAGSYQLATGPPFSGDRIGAALNCLAHRGPDDEGIYRSGRATLGHRRLSIIDTTEAGHQPFTDEGGRFTIVFNGEVFNFQQLRTELESQGHAFRSRTDTEVVLRLYALKGEAFLDDLNGFFALAIHDAELDELFVARDRFGVKPVWWCMHEGAFHFASELCALQALGAPTLPDRSSLYQYFTYHYIPAPHSVLQGVSKLMPGHRLHVGSRGMEQGRWYDLALSIQSRTGALEPVRQVQELLESAVHLRLVADVPVGTFLSGGLDSSIVSALAARHHKDLHTYSIGFADDPWFDETRYAEAVAERIGSTHTTFKLTRDDLARHYTGLLEATDEPFADSSALASYILCMNTRRHVKVALSGDGADEVFGGYSKHQAELRYRSPRATEKAVIALTPLWRQLPRSRSNPIFNFVRRLHRFAETSHGSASERWLDLAAFDTDGDAQDLVAPTPRPFDRDEAMVEGLDRVPDLNGFLLADVLQTLPNDMLHKVDLTSMAHGLEVRTPFLDRRLVEFAFALPAERKFRPGSGKRLLREAFGHLLPPAVLARGKRGFEVPLRELLVGQLSGLVAQLLREDLVQEAGLSWAAVQRVRQRLHSSNPGQSQATTHALLVYLAWWKKQASRPAAAI